MVVRRHPLIAFFVLADVLTWWIYPLLKFSPLLGPFGLGRRRGFLMRTTGEGSMLLWSMVR